MPNSDELPKTVKVRVAVAVDSAGGWYARGDNEVPPAVAASEARECVQPHGHVSFLTTELPIPEPVEVAAKVEDAPDLLAALENLYANAKAFNRDTDECWAVLRDQVLAAIAKAKGEKA